MQMNTIHALTTSALALSLSGSVFGQFDGSLTADTKDTARATVYSKLLNTRLPVDFTADSLRDVIEFLSEYSEIDILTKWDESGFGDGLDPATPITVQLQSPTALESILEIVMKQATSDETSWNLGDGFVQIGLKESLNQEKYTRVYPVQDLLFQVPQFENGPEMDLEAVLGGGDTGEISGYIFTPINDDAQNDRLPELAPADELIDVITSIIDPLQWEINGGEGGSIRYFKGTIIVNAADFLHRQIAGYPFDTTKIVRALRTAAANQEPQSAALTGPFGFAKLIGLADAEVPVLIAGNARPVTKNNW